MPNGLSRICLVSASRENVFFGEILEAFGDALGEHGFAIEHSVDCFPSPADDLVCLFIPHEYMALVDGLAHPTPEQLRRTVAISTEQPGTSWFEIAFEVAGRAGAVVDINRLAAEEMNRRGVRAAHAPLGYIPGWDVWGGEESGEREIDLAFLGRYTEDRARKIARCVPALERRRAAIHLTETVEPHVTNSHYYLAGRRRSELLANSKLLLNVHQQQLAYFEWHRILSAVLSGCVVVSEHSLMTDPFEPGQHFLSARPDDLPLVLEGILADPDRMRRIRHRAYDLVREEMPMSAAIAVLTAAIERAAANPIRESSLGFPSPVPMPKPPAALKPGWEVYAEQIGEQLPTRRALMDLVIRARTLEQRVEELLNGNDQPVDAVEVEELGPQHEQPRISVLLTVFNHAQLVGNAIRSIARGDVRDLEIIAVDDASTDGSSEAIRAACAEFPWLGAKLVRRTVNSGLPATARNLAFKHARGKLLFILDADNSALPQGLSKLAAALEDDLDAAFAYGIIERFNAGGSVGLFSWLDWDPDRLRGGNYIDAMAMIRREALEAVGGYPTEHALAGWEDFALWLAMADTGRHGVRVPDFVGRYLISQHSMLSISGIDHSTPWMALMRNYAGAMGTAS